MNFFFTITYHYLICFLLYIISKNIDYTILLDNTESLRMSNYKMYENINNNFYRNVLVTLPIVNNSFELYINIHSIDAYNTSYEMKHIIMLCIISFLFLFYKNTNYNTSIISNPPVDFLFFCFYFNYVAYYVNTHNIPYSYILIVMKIVFNTITSIKTTSYKTNITCDNPI